MTTAVQPAGAGQMGRPSASGLADVIDTILDKGLVIDAYVRVSLVGIEILTIDARVIVASVDTYLRFAEAANRLDLAQSEQGLPEVIAQAKGQPSVDKTKDVIQGVLEAADEKLADFADQAAEKRQKSSRVEREGK
ncbi:gas vesicle structural protein GvpA [Nonomuraea turkmeniaca]|uniref:Gas vesicle protein A n=1 Tax=Nonomuraea turkmeniaca TaxID=103838 RepID=A0A5S4FBY7_9ACTN|nr:gas vesicle protein GvpJ [Nonomuraea turkmeniaca]TMR15342.1 gas vesicle structural protein GvpA [Nonomuraea turkmeniaca]